MVLERIDVPPPKPGVAAETAVAVENRARRWRRPARLQEIGEGASCGYAVPLAIPAGAEQRIGIEIGRGPDAKEMEQRILRRHRLPLPSGQFRIRGGPAETGER